MTLPDPLIVGQRIRVDAKARNRSGLTDLDEPEATVRSPTNERTNPTVKQEEGETGLYHFEFVADEAGTWRVRLESPNEAAAEFGIRVHPSEVLP